MSASRGNPFSNAVIVGYSETPVSRGRVDRGEQQLSMEEYYTLAIEQTLIHAGLEKDDVENQGLALSGSISTHSEIWSVDMCEMLGFSPSHLIHSDHGGAAGLAMLRDAMLAVSNGLVNICVCAAADAPQTDFSLEATGYIRDFEYPVGVQGPNDMFALIMRRHMFQYGTTEEQIGRIAVAERTNSNRNPNAYFFKTPIGIEDYLKSRTIADPIKLLDCVMRVNGGLGFVVASRDKAKEILKNTGRRGVYLAGFGECDNHLERSRSLPDITYTGMGPASKRAFGMAGITQHSVKSVQQDQQPNASELRKKIDFLQPYDDYCVCVLMQIEDMGFCKKGEGGRFVEEHDLTWRGDFPVNTGGGQISSGQPGLAGGHVNLVEGIRQLMHEGGNRQVKDAKLGVVTGFGGNPNLRCIMNNMVAVLANEEGV